MTKKEELAMLHANAGEAWENLMRAYYIISDEGEDLLGQYEDLIEVMPEGPEKEKVKEELDNIQRGYAGLDECKDYIGMIVQPEIKNYEEMETVDFPGLKQKKPPVKKPSTKKQDQAADEEYGGEPSEMEIEEAMMYDGEDGEIIREFDNSSVENLNRYARYITELLKLKESTD